MLKSKTRRAVIREWMARAPEQRRSSQQALAFDWISRMGAIKRAHPERPLYWLLLVKGHRTFRYLPLFAKSFFPHWSIDRSDLKPLADELASAMFPRDRVISSLVKYAIDFSEDEYTEVLREKLANFYAKRTLTGQPVTLDSQVRAITAFLDGNFAKTTGQIVNVDGGQAAAFLR